MMMQRFLYIAAMATLLLFAASCITGARLREGIPQIEKKIHQARERGAYRCAPRELATAEASLEFLKYEISTGDFIRAKEHHDIAITNAERAIEITDPAECADKMVTIRQPTQVVIARTDTDGDGLMDDVDQCPEDPEDPDGFEDEDGCPDPDNDLDTILDQNDACPLEPGVPNEDPAKNGCPVQDRDGDGIPDDVDKCPDEPEDLDGNEDHDGCPELENVDSDGDGILDQDDQCPADPEDKDNFQDEDGCPDLDNDGDTVLDTEDECPLDPGLPENKGCPVRDRDGDGINDSVDACPDVPGFKNKNPRKNGCPKKVLVVKTKDKIEIKKKIRFATGKARIVGRTSFDILEQINAVLKSNPEIKLVIEGHTDSRGSAAYNLRLSDQRANAVMEQLITLGTNPNRIQAIGYGESKPIESNKSRRGRAQNRRVEFKIVQ